MLGDRIKETATVTGTGDITLSGAVASYVTYSSNFTNAARCIYMILCSDNTWEFGLGTYNSGANSITRTTVLSNSSGNTSLITFGAGTFTVICDVPAESIAVVGGAYSIPRTAALTSLDNSWLNKSIPRVDIVSYTYFGGA